jgi:hypothetical protein
MDRGNSLIIADSPESQGRPEMELLATIDFCATGTKMQALGKAAE